MALLGWPRDASVTKRLRNGVGCAIHLSSGEACCGAVLITAFPKWCKLSET